MFKRLIALALVLALDACAREESPETEPAAAKAPAPALAARQAATEKEINPRLLRRFARIASKADTSNSVTPEKVRLGQMLYFETRLSKSHTLSCNSCHTLDKYGVDGMAKSVGHKGQQGLRNTPTVYNAAAHFQLFWDGRATTIEAQATLPIVNPLEMASSDTRVISTLRSMPDYVAAFEAAFPESKAAVTMNNVGRAIGAFERKLVTSSRWDKYIAGDVSALTQREKHGLRVFLNSGCMVCHTGPQVGAATFQKVGAVEPWPNQADQGRYEVTKLAADKMVFKVPSLRNIEKTAPYFHDGSAATLEQAISMMGRYQLGLELAQDDVSAMVTWMKSLTGEVPTEYARAPALPPSTAATPKPDLN